MKKLLAFFLAVMVIVSVTGCSSNTNVNTASESVSNTAASSVSNTAASSVSNTDSNGVSPESTFPITSKKTTISVMVPTQSNIIDISTNDFTKYYEDKTNIHVNWNVVPSENLTDKVNLSLSSGDLPDAYMDCNISLSQQAIFGSEGAFLDLTPYISKYSKLLTQAFQVVPNLKSDLTMGDGKIYALPYLEDNLHVLYSHKMWLNQTWLDKLGLKIPETTDDFYKMLLAFKNDDPNGNGKKDEIPLATSTDGWNSWLDGFIMSAFVFDDPSNNRLYVDSGKVTAAYSTDRWRQGLEYLHKLYAEGLIDPQSFTQTTTQLQAKCESKECELVGVVPGGGPTGFDIGIPKGRWSKMVAIPPLTGPNGLKVAWYNPLGTTSLTKFIITKAAKNPDAVFRWSAEQYDVAMSQRRIFGLEDKNWKKAGPGKVDRAGKQAEVEINIDGLAWSDKQNYSWRSLGVRLETPLMPDNQWTQALPGDPSTDCEFNLYKFTKENYAPYGEDPSMLLPPLSYTPEESTTIADIGTVMNTYVTQMMARFITGDANLSKDWDSYIAQLNSKGLPKLLAAYQEAYDKKFKK